MAMTRSLASRAFQQFNKVSLEKKWMRTSYEKPSGIPETDVLDRLHEFEKLIWEYPADVMLPKYDHTPEEMATLCSEGGAGWLISSQIEWIFQILNSGQKRVINMVTCMTTPEVVRSMALKCGKELVKYNFVLNVGKNDDGSVFIASHLRSGNHWVLVSVDMECRPARVYYCDSLGWDCRADLADYLSPFIAGFETHGYPSIIMMHSPSKNGPHQCSNRCKNYPLQRCSSVCGVVAVICAAIATLDETYFSLLCGEQICPKLFLSDPTKYDKYLRRVLMYWFISARVDISLLRPSFVHVCFDHSYSHSPSGLKRKLSVDSFSEIPSKVSIVCENEGDKTIGHIALDHSYSQVGSNFQVSVKEDKAQMALKDAIDSGNAISCEENMAVDLSLQISDLEDLNNLSTPIDGEAVSTNFNEYVCSLCSKSYLSAQSLHKHRKQKHFIRTKSLSAPSCMCSLCSYRGKSIKSLIAHYNSDHGKKIEILETRFDCTQDFEKWKFELEQSSDSHFTLHRGKQQLQHSSVKRYYCNRSGMSRLKEVRKKAMKLQGSNKLNYFCTSFMFVEEDMSSGSLNVQYCLEHTNHTCDLMHLPLSDNVKSQIVGKLSQGLEPSAVLESVRDDIVSINRDSLVTKKDIHNLKAKHTYCKSQKHNDDSHSVDLWVQDLLQDENNPVIYYKAQNIKHELLEESDFLLCIQTKFQREMLRKHGSKIICMDSTHCTTQYDFLLITILVLDDFCEAVPVAWAVANREDVQLLDIFLNAVKISVEEDFTTNIFMSDMAENFYAAWCRCFRKPVQKLHCSWHVDRSWRNKLNVHVKDGDMKNNVYSVLKALQYECDESRFRNLLQKALAFFDKEAKEFGKYFQKTYVHKNKPLLWAACFRQGTLANTNMYAEAFHNVLKSVYFKRKQNRRVDSLLFVLLKMARDKNIEQIIKLEKGKFTYRMNEIRQRHNDGNSVEDITTVSDSEWSVPSKQRSQRYIVKKLQSELCKCKLHCPSCSVCVHQYSCTCIDFLLKGIGCKHIHAIHMKNIQNYVSTADKNKTDDDCESLSKYKSFMSKKVESPSGNLDKRKLIALRYAKVAIDVLASTKSSDTVDFLSDLFKKAASGSQGLEKLEGESKLKKKRVFTPNQLFLTQKGFCSTKKKTKKVSKTRLHANSGLAQLKLYEQILLTSPKVCAFCFSKCDRMGGSGATYFQCKVCQCWIHNACDVQIPCTEAENGVCSMCR